jgi:hypothetical protein
VNTRLPVTAADPKKKAKEKGRRDLSHHPRLETNQAKT